jgi:hypothetical protein
VDEELVRSTGTWFVISIVSIFLGCWPLGAVATYMAHEAKQYAGRGQNDEARSKLGTAKVCSMISVGGFVLLTLFWIVMMIIGVAMAPR